MRNVGQNFAILQIFFKQNSQDILVPCEGVQFGSAISFTLSPVCDIRVNLKTISVCHDDRAYSMFPST